MSVKDNGKVVGLFNIVFKEFEDRKRKECFVDFKEEEEISPNVQPNEAYLYYEAQLIENEMEYFQELQDMLTEDRGEALNFRNDFLEIKRKLAGLFRATSINERVTASKQVNTLNNADNLSVTEKLKLSKVGNKHHSLRTSYVDTVKMSSMIPIEYPSNNKVITDRHVLYPLVEEGNLFSCFIPLFQNQ